MSKTDTKDGILSNNFVTHTKYKFTLNECGGYVTLVDQCALNG